jgi:CHASE2 domain-containing sensor protein
MAAMKAWWRRVVPTPALLGKKLARAAPWLIAFTLLGLFLEHVGLLTPLSNFGRDTFGIVRGVRAPVDVRIVDVDDTSYDSLFHGRSPLDPAALRRLIDAIETARPSVIAVDLLTSSAAFASLADVPSWTVPIVWAEDVAPADPACSATDGSCAFRAGLALGGRVHDDPDACVAGRVCGAIPLYLRRGGVTREYVQRLPYPGLDRRPSLAWAIVVACANSHQPPTSCRTAYARARDDDEAHQIDVTAPNPWPYTQNALNVLSFAESHSWAVTSELRDHIVIVGGSYRLQDRHHVAGQEVSGAWLNAQVVENELHGPTGEVAWFIGPIIDLAIGVVLVYLLYRFRLAPALAASAGFIAFVLLATFLAFGRLGVWLDFVPILVGVTLHELQEHVPEYLRLAAAEEKDPA